MRKSQALAMTWQARDWHWALAMALAAAISLTLARSAWSESRNRCGDDHPACSTAERCCEHTIATFCSDNSCASSYVHGECVPQNQGCGDFWCGNRHCKTNWFISNDVCCIYTQEGAPPYYTCASSEISCPGNMEQLTIREKIASRKLESEEN